MPIDRNRLAQREIARDLAAAFAVLGATGAMAPGALAQAAGGADGIGRESNRALTAEQQAITNAASLYDQGQVVEARSILDRVAQAASLGKLSDEQRTQAFELLRKVDTKIRATDAVEISVQRAELSVRDGDLNLAERHAKTVLTRSYASAEQKARASAALESVMVRREAIRPALAGMIEQARADFGAKRYPSAKATVMAVQRSGLPLSMEQSTELERYQLQIVEVERVRGTPFDVSGIVGVSMLEPGTVRSNDPNAAQPSQVPQPAPIAPASNEPASSEPASSEPASSEPAASAPEAPAPVIAIPATSAPAQTQPVTEPMSAEPMSAEPVTSAPMATEPASITPAHEATPREMVLAHAMASSDEPAATAPQAPAPVQEAPLQPAVAASEQPSSPVQPVNAEPAPVVTPATPQVSSQDALIAQALRAEGQRYIAEGDQAYDQSRYSVAVDRYTLALAQFRGYLASSDIERAERRLSEARVRLEGGGADRGLGQRVVENLKLQRDQATAAFDDQVAQSQAKLASGDTAKAQSFAERARLSITNARGAFNDSEFDGFMKRLDDLTREIDARREAISRDETAKREKDNVERAKKAEDTRALDRDRKVNEAIDRVRALQSERKYKEALQVVDQALFLNPNDPTALLLRDILRDIVIYQRYNNTRDENAYRHSLQTLDNQQALLPPTSLMEFPTDWPKKTFERGELSAFSDSAENRRVLAAMSNPSSRIPVDLKENRFEDVLQFLAKVSNLPIDPDWETLAAVGVEKDTPVTLKLPPVTLETALNKLMGKVSKDQFSRAGWAVSEGVIGVASEESLRKAKTLVIYNIQDLLFNIPSHPDVPQIDLNNVLQSSSGGSGTSPFNNTNQNTQVTPQVLEQQRQERVRRIVDIIQANVDFEGWKDNGGETGALQELNGSLIITNTPRNHREIVGLLSKLREIRNMQINVETKFLLVNQDWFEQVGFDLDIVFNANNNQVQRARQNDPSVLPSDLFNFGGSGGGTRGLQRQVTGQGPINGRLGPITNSDRTSQAIVPPTGGTSPIGTASNSLGITNSLAQGDFANAILAGAPALGIAGQFLDDIQVDFLIQATQVDRRTVQLTAPRLTFTNGQTSNIYVVTQQAFVSDLQPVTGDSAVGFDPTVSVVSEGVTMLVEGVVSADRRYVTMNIDAGVARIDGFAQQAVTAVAGGQLVSSQATQSFIQLPTVTVTRVRTTATVPDEGTLLLGGQRLVTEVEVETGVPVLSKIPIINRFFTNRLESKSEQTLLILVKPTIIIQSEEEERSYPGLTDSVRTGSPLR